MELSYNANELVVDKYREILLPDLNDGKILARLTQIESPKLDITSESDEVVDATGALIMELFKAKKASFTAENSLFSLDLAALQVGGEKNIGSATNKILMPISEQIDIKEDKVSLSQIPVGTIKYVYKLVNKGFADTFELGTGETVEDGKFKITGKEITLPTGTKGTLFVSYSYETEAGLSIDASATKFPETTGFIAHVIFKDPCNENLKIAGAIVAPKAKIDPSSISFDFSRGAKHSLAIKFAKDYCDYTTDKLFSIIIAKE